MVATRDIVAGECIFVTPPTVYANPQDVRKEYLKRYDIDSSVTLEDVAVEILVEKMWNSIVENDRGTFNSFLVLMGSSSIIMRENTNDSARNSIDSQSLNISTLLGHDGEDYWGQDELLEKEKFASRDDLKKILFKNAFGPDFITYEKMQQQWKASHVDYTPHHILGIYPLAAMLNHSCVSNATRTYSNEIMIVHASKNIPAGSEIVWSYIPPTQPFADRRRALKERHGFICKCEKCQMESNQLKNDALPVTMSRTISEVYKWNRSLIDVGSLDNVSKRHLCMLYDELNDTVFSSTSLSNELKRYLRIDITNFYFNYLNAVLSDIGSINATCTATYEKLLNTAMQLHFAFCTSNNGSTEHLSVLHLCYELASAVHQGNNSDPRLTTLSNKVRFWTEQLRKAHIVRYGFMGDDVENTRKLLVHTRQILRQRDGFLKLSFNFL